MKRTILLSILAVLLAFALPALLSAAPGRPSEPEREEPPVPELTPAPAADSLSAAHTPILDAGITLTVHTEEGDVEMSMAEYLPRALAGEMPAAFDAEALKAQAVALRSYALHYRANRKDAHPEADICTSPGCCAAFADEDALRANWGANYETYMAKIEAAAADTDGQYLVWESEPILAVFHASSAGRTEDGAALGVGEPYLVSVETPETAGDVTNLLTTVEVTPEDLRSTVLGMFPEASFPDGDPAGWIGPVTLNAAGRVASVQIGGVSVSGLTLRQLFALRSTDFMLAWDAEAQYFVFRVRGYGHGVGLSQHGANLMARSGADYAEILAHYYPGTELVMAMTG